MGDAARACTKCGVVKPVESGFRRNASYHDGYTRQCIECIGRSRRERYHAAPERERAVSEEWKRANRQRVYQRARERRYQALVAYAGNPPACACCGESELAFLSFDHVDGGGRAHRRQTGGGGFVSWLRTNGYPPGFRVLCHNCNQGRRITGGECPHVRAREEAIA